MQESLEVLATLLLDKAFQALAVILVGLFTAAVGYIVRWLRSKLSQAQWERLKAAAREVVLAMEQAKIAGAVSKEAAVVKRVAMEKLRARLNEIGLKKFAENTELLSTTIESTVFEEFNRKWLELQEELTALG